MPILNLPKSAKVDKFIAKKTFASKVPNAKAFFGNIEKIIWAYKLSPKTINIPNTTKVEEIHIFDIQLKSKELPKKALYEIQKPIPYPILFRLIYDSKFCYAISLLEQQNYYFTEFDERVKFNFLDTDLEKVYQNIVKKFLKNIKEDSSIDFKQSIEIDKHIKTLEKEIQTLENKLKKEKQFNKQLELSRQLKPKEKELKGLL